MAVPFGHGYTGDTPEGHERGPIAVVALVTRKVAEWRGFSLHQTLPDTTHFAVMETPT